MEQEGYDKFIEQLKRADEYYTKVAAKKNTPKITQALIDETKAAMSNVPFKGADQYITDRQNAIAVLADKNNVRLDDLMNAARADIAKESVGKGGMISGIKAREGMLASGKLAAEEVMGAKNFIADTENYLFPKKLTPPSVKELTRAGGGMNTLGNVIGPAIAVAQGATVAQGIMDKMKAGESFKEAASNPELVKDAARGVLGYMGANAGALAGSMAPGGLPAKAAAELAGAVGVGYAGSKLADLLTGNPVVDKIIRARYEQARNERMAKTKPTAASSVELRPGE
jgi:hypothetical protein